jgi:hypothetical protein
MASRLKRRIPVIVSTRGAAAGVGATSVVGSTAPNAPEWLIPVTTYNLGTVSPGASIPLTGLYTANGGTPYFSYVSGQTITGTSVTMTVDPADGDITAPTTETTYTAVIDLTADTLGNELGTLVHDGPATPEQISLYLPITGTLSSAATATVEYSANGTTWATAHPLFRIIPADVQEPTIIPVDPAFAGVIFDLTPGTAYQVRVTVTDGAASSVLPILSCTTRALPAATGATTVSIAAGSSTAAIQSAISNAPANSVVEFANGTYTLNSRILITNKSGVVVRGASRAGVVLQYGAEEILNINGSPDTIIERLTLQGSGVDSGESATSVGIAIQSDASSPRATVRNVTMVGVDRGVISGGAQTQTLVYDCTITGNDTWSMVALPDPQNNDTWNDDCIRLAGQGNCAFNNTVTGFGDSFSVSTDESVLNLGVHFYRNRVNVSCDDAAELDNIRRTSSFYDNECRNVGNCFSADPVMEGPTYVFRNRWVNVAKATYKLNSGAEGNNGLLMYNNTVVRQRGLSTTATAEYGWFQIAAYENRGLSYRNNALIWKGSGLLDMVKFQNSVGNLGPLDMTHNAWYPNQGFDWDNYGGTFSTLVAAQAGVSNFTPVFSGTARPHANDRISEADPFATDVVFAGDWQTQVSTVYTLALDPASTLKAAGVVIPGITDGHSDAAPDIGAVIAGRTAPQVGDRS